jgi:phage terminase large subunit-like protein
MYGRPRKRWAEEVIEQFACISLTGDHDDLVDSSTQALLRFRQGGFINLDSDEPFDDPVLVRKADYY